MKPKIKKFLNDHFEEGELRDRIITMIVAMAFVMALPYLI